MIKIHQGDLLENVKSGIIVHGCNAQGVMGAGFAKAVKIKYPEAFEKYREFCKTKTEGYREFDSVLGHCSIVQINEDLFIVNAITQEFYGKNKQFVDYNAVRSCFKEVADLVITEANYKINRMQNHGISTALSYLPPVHFPKIGAGHGGGDWDQVAKIIEEELGEDIEQHLWVLE